MDPNRTAPQPEVDPSRNDQITFRFFLKTVGLLVHERLPAGSCNFGDDTEGAVGLDGQHSKGPLRLDKWFDTPLPEPDLLRPSLTPYRAVSTTYHLYLPTLVHSEGTLKSADLPARSKAATRAPTQPSGLDSGASSFADIRSGGAGGGGSSKPSSGTDSISGSGSEVRVRRPEGALQSGGEIGGRPLERGNSNTGDDRFYQQPSRNDASSSISPAPLVGFANLPPLVIEFILDLSGYDQVIGARTDRSGRRDVERIRPGEPETGKTDDRAREGRGETRWPKNEQRAGRTGSVGGGTGTGEEIPARKQRKRIPGIVLERWTLKSFRPTPENLSTASIPPFSPSSTDGHPSDLLDYATRIQPSASTAYRSGIAHFQTLRPYLRRLPLQSVVSRLQDENRVDPGIEPSSSPRIRLEVRVRVEKRRRETWNNESHQDPGKRSTSGVSNLEEADFSKSEEEDYDLEDGLLGSESPGDPVDLSPMISQELPPVLMPNALLRLSVETRTDLSELLDMYRAGSFGSEEIGLNRARESAGNSAADEQTFVPATLQRGNSGVIRRGSQGDVEGARAPATWTPPNRTRMAGLSASRPTIISLDRGSSQALPALAQPVAPTSATVPVANTFNRRSSLGIRSYTNLAPTYGSQERSSPPAVPIMAEISSGQNPGSSRPSSLLSISSRSMTQLDQVSGSRPRLQSLLTSPELARQGTPPQRQSGTYTGLGVPTSPMESSVPRNSSSQSLARIASGSHSYSPTPPIPEGSEGDVADSGGPQSFKRYGSSFGQRQRPSSLLGSIGSPGETGSPLAPVSSSLRRSGGLASGAGRGSIGSGSGISKAPLSQSEAEDISNFLRSLDSMPAPPSIMAMSSAQARPQGSGPATILLSRAPSFSTSSASQQLPGYTAGPAAGPADPATLAADSQATSTILQRKPLTKRQVEDALKRMASSYIGSGQPFAQPASDPSVSIQRTPSFGARREITPNVPVVGNLSGRLAGASSPVLADGPSGYGQIGNLPTSFSRENMLNRAASSSVKSSSPLAGAPIYTASSLKSRIVDQPGLSPATPATRDPTRDDAVANQASESSAAGSDSKVSPIQSPPEARPIAKLVREAEYTRAVQSLPGSKPALASPLVVPKTVDDITGMQRPQPTITSGFDLVGPSGTDSSSGDREIGGGRRRHRAPVLLRGGFSPAPSSSRESSADQGLPSTRSAHPGASNWGQANTTISPRMVPLPGGNSPLTLTGALPSAALNRSSGTGIISPMGLTPSGLPPAIDQMVSPPLRNQRTLPVVPAGGFAVPAQTAQQESNARYQRDASYWSRGDRERDQMTGIGYGLTHGGRTAESERGSGRGHERRYPVDQYRRDETVGERYGRVRVEEQQEPRGRTPDDGDEVLGRMEMSEHGSGR